MSPLARRLNQRLVEAESRTEDNSDHRLDLFRSIERWIVDARLAEPGEISHSKFLKLLEMIMPAIGKFEYEVRLDTLERIDSPDLLVFRASREAFAYALTGTRGAFEPDED